MSDQQPLIPKDVIHSQYLGVQGTLLATLEPNKELLLNNPALPAIGIIRITDNVVSQVLGMEMYEQTALHIKVEKGEGVEATIEVFQDQNDLDPSVGYMFGFDCEYTEGSATDGYDYFCSTATITHLGKGVKFSTDSGAVSTSGIPPIVSFVQHPLSIANGKLSGIDEMDFNEDFNIAHNLNNNIRALGDLTIDPESRISRAMGVWINTPTSLVHGATHNQVKSIRALGKAVYLNEDSEVYDSEVIYVLEILPGGLINMLCLTYESITDDYYIRKVSDLDAYQIPRALVSHIPKVGVDSLHQLYDRSYNSIQKEFSDSIQDLVKELKPEVAEEMELRKTFDKEDTGNLITFASRKS